MFTFVVRLVLKNEWSARLTTRKRFKILRNRAINKHTTTTRFCNKEFNAQLDVIRKSNVLPFFRFKVTNFRSFWEYVFMTSYVIVSVLSFAINLSLVILIQQSNVNKNYNRETQNSQVVRKNKARNVHFELVAFLLRRRLRVESPRDFICMNLIISICSKLK